jgi:Legionella pneumophila major outer membrane protein precursor
MEKRTFGITGLLLATATSLCASDLPSSTQGQESAGLVNPSSRFEVDNGWNLFLNTEFLWWVAKEDGLYYAQSGYTGAQTSVVPPDGTKNFKGHLEKVKPHFRPGFRIGFGGNMGYDEWDILLNWTWFQSHARDHSHGLLLTLWGHPEAANFGNNLSGALSANAKWSLHLNIIDLEMGRAFWVGRHFSLRPFFGIRGAWIDQHLNVRYDYTTTPITKGKIRADSDFEGGGVRAGLDTRYTLFGGWSFYGIASASMLYGHYDCDFSERWSGVKVAKTSDGFHNAASTAQLALGVRWDTYVHKDRYHFGLYAGWEQNIWFGLNKMNHFFGNLSDGNLEQMNGDLSLSGGTFGVRFDF